MDRKKSQIHRKSYNEVGHVHELTFSCYNNIKFFKSDVYCQWFADSLSNACGSLKFSLWVYVFMPDHIHLIVHPEQSIYSISDFLKQVKQPFSRKVLSYLRSNSPEWLSRLKQIRGKTTEYHIWQRGGGYDRNVLDGETLLKMIDYIHLNPVRKEFVERVTDWKWSSAGWFEGIEPKTLRPDVISKNWMTM
ncbi:transposase [Rubinisphaera sp.]|uniref:REP-associated tyrosine transposase n=1 Tax=Rubinisphaera sp. TaxID=2024857 RepID=UPI0025EA8336|nr:transposase [Rubinisphaera sp.]